MALARISEFESFQASQPVRGPFRTHGLRFIPETWVTLSAERDLDGFEPAGLVVEIAEIVIHEGDEPDILADLFDAHLLPSKYDAEIDFLPIEADAPARRHGDSLIVEWVVEVGQAGCRAVLTEDSTLPAYAC